jgi:hypothetical protein
VMVVKVVTVITVFKSIYYDVIFFLLHTAVWYNVI